EYFTPLKPTYLSNHAEPRANFCSWGRSKYWVRRHCKYTIQCLRENVTKSYAVEDDRLNLDIVQKYCMKVANFHSVYADKHTGPDAVQRRREYRSHRKPAPSEFINPA
ncbi:unnamed protein product, partial [Pylaiella littoralis]